MEGELRTEQEIIGRFQEMRSNVNALWNKINELEAEMSEHDLVIKALQPMEAGRKCFRLIGGVLVERTVAEVLPAVQGHREQLEKLVAKLKDQGNTKKQELLEFQQKYKIRIKGEENDEEEAGSSKSGAQGVLVSNK